MGKSIIHASLGRRKQFPDGTLGTIVRTYEITGGVLLTGTSSDARNDATLTSALIKYPRFNQIDQREFVVSLLRS